MSGPTSGYSRPPNLIPGTTIATRGGAEGSTRGLFSLLGCRVAGGRGPELVEGIRVLLVHGDLGDSTVVDLEVERVDHVERDLAGPRRDSLDCDHPLRVHHHVDQFHRQRSPAEDAQLLQKCRDTRGPLVVTADW